jgi:uncharacterized protein YecE (DUF72 family)
MLDDHPREITADFAYVRFHGPDKRYGGSYPDEALARWGEQLLAWHRGGLDAFAYFNNDAGGFAVANASTLVAACGQPALPPLR